MKKLYKTLLSAVALISFMGTASSQVTATFEDLGLPANSYWDGSDQSHGFTSGDSYFSNVYDTSFGGYWAYGWTYSSLTDTTTPGYTNPYSAFTGSGFNSQTYAVGQRGATIKFTGGASRITDTLYVTNATYPAISMRDGDWFAKKFGGTSGNDPDWFKLSIYAYSAGVKFDSVEVYLADFRFSDNTQDYILDTWQQVPLQFNGWVDSLMFGLTSSDTGSFGMNTPAYFAIDNFKTQMPVGLSNTSKGTLSIYPNPATDVLNINIMDHSTIKIYNALGQPAIETMAAAGEFQVQVNSIIAGVYFIEVSSANEKKVTRFIKR
jgi:hypothetical protein